MNRPRKRGRFFRAENEIVGAGALDGPFASTLYMFIRGFEGAAPYMFWIELFPQLHDNLFNKSFLLRKPGKNDIII